VRHDVLHPADCRCGHCARQPGRTETLLAILIVAAGIVVGGSWDSIAVTLAGIIR
jgi:hypothetical protein